MTSGDTQDQAQLKTRSYLICTEPRTGSTLLSDGLTGTGIAGMPDEYFGFGKDKDYWLTRFDAQNDFDYIDQLVKKTSSSNGVFGAKVHWNHTKHLKENLVVALRNELSNAGSAELEFLLRTKLQSPQYVWLRRKNKIAQAISFYRASRSGVWRSIKGRSDQYNVPDEALEFDPDAIDQFVKIFQKMDFSWNNYFRINRITALMIFYEDLAANYELVIRGVLKFLKLPMDVNIPESTLDRQSDGRSLDWERNYRKLRAGTELVAD